MTNREQPDPGDGWRLLEAGEVILDGDEFTISDGKVWEPRFAIGDIQQDHYEPTRRYVGEQQPDFVNSPPHYRQGEIECIDAIRAALTEEEFRGFCKGNVIKYTWRERHKAGDADLGKAVDYLNYTQTKEATK